MVWANPVRSRQGPLSPKAGIRTMISSGLSAWSCSNPTRTVRLPRRVVLHQDISRVNQAFERRDLPSGRARSRVAARLPTLAVWKTGPHSHHRSSVGGRVLANRI